MSTKFRSVPFSEISKCLRLDAHHYLPSHREYEHDLPKPSPTRREIIAWWLRGVISTKKLQEAIAFYREHGE